MADDNPKISAVIFDMDGLLLDTERVALAAWQGAMTDLGYEPATALFISTVGTTYEETAAIYRRALGPAFPLAAMQARELAHFEAVMAEQGAPLKPGAVELLDLLDRLALPRGVASSTVRRGVEKLLAAAGLLKRFDVLVGGDEIVHGKPAPDIFLEAARRLGVAPQGCLVLEDSAHGVRAAHAAGMWPIMVPDLVTPTPETEALAFRVMPTLHDVAAWIGD